MLSIAILGLAAGLDFILGDPWGWTHPVQVMGWAIDRGKARLLAWEAWSQGQRWGGVALTVAVVGGSGGVGWLLVAGGNVLDPRLGGAIATVLLASCFAGRSLRHAAQSVLEPLRLGDLDLARSHLALYVGRDTTDLSEAEILRAVLETVTENAVDGVLAPLFYGLVGAAIPGLGSVPLALAYKAASTLDSMVGYRAAPYTHLGWFSARFEDGFTWLPCRCAVVTLALLSGQPRRVLAVCRRDAPQDPSPNAGWSECVYAAIVGVQMGGVNRYGGQLKTKPLLGDPLRPISPDRIREAMALTRLCFLVWLGLGCAILWGLSLV
ncbi:adenosylcobinamide-phosphate synthase CbiB [Prochlorothrix hollandica]|uniref:Cobalamin biosynthesis protein CobD n=1 Tax=Prochlorothrix hollandica PCC 9006 = CALU 1027 TaxID=317619 RepID=A0A0M2PTJ3_PROHO|nr:adenosylcobinamide-phosphate synthase CbiB [Prochlorothrix hollandica]KKI98472.1 cobalamin biosynthesis protein CobD [Prochlorothrix hollandica PCC 9006 = CALU 1027]